MTLVDPEDVATYLQRRVSPQAADLAVRMAESWVRPLVRSVSWPPDRQTHPDLWAYVVELAAMAVDNPTSMVSTATGGQTDQHSAVRRTEILADVASRYGAVQPIGVFPPPTPWPDGVDRSHRW